MRVGFILFLILLNFSCIKAENNQFGSHVECSSGQSFIRCKPDSDEFCISSVFKDDGFQNCPPPTASDEPNKQRPQKQPNNQNNNQNQQSHQHKPSSVSKNYMECSIFFLTAFVTFTLNFIF